MSPMAYATTRSPPAWIRRGRLSANGVNATSNRDLPAYWSNLVAGVQPACPPSVVLSIKALAGELPHEHQLPLSQLSIPEIRAEAIKRGIVASIGKTTVWRWLSEEAIRPWTYRRWVFPRDPAFQEKANRVLELYEGFWNGEPLGAQDFLLSTDEKTSIQARRRTHPTLRPSAGRPMRVEHEYERAGAWAYFAAWDVRRARTTVAVSARRASSPSQGSPGRSWIRSPTARPSVCSGQWTTALPTGAKRASGA